MRTKTLLMTVAFAMSSLGYAQATNGTISTQGKKEKDYHNLATISLQDAIQAALAKVPGKAVEAELDSEGGFLVFEVKVIANDSSTHKVQVDAGNKNILKDDVKTGMF